MTSGIATPSPRTASRIAGIGYAIIFVLAIFANFIVRQGLIDPDSAATTFANIAESEFLFRAGMVSFLAVFIVDVMIAWALYILFKAVSKEVSLLAAWFRLVYTVFLGVALIFFFMVLDLVSGAAYLTAFEPGQLDGHVTLLLNAFNYAWLIGLAGFGIHLMLLGYLMIASGKAPKTLGIFLVIAGVAYVFDTLANTLVSNYMEYETIFLVIVAVPSVVAELWFTVWLLTKGGAQQEALQ